MGGQGLVQDVDDDRARPDVRNKKVGLPQERHQGCKVSQTSCCKLNVKGALYNFFLKKKCLMIIEHKTIIE